MVAINYTNHKAKTVTGHTVDSVTTVVGGGIVMTVTVTYSDLTTQKLEVPVNKFVG